MNTSAGCLRVVAAVVLTVLLVIGFDAATAGALQQPGATLTIHNNSDKTISHVFIAERDATTWGRDWLGDDDIAPGASYTFTLQSGVYDVLLVDSKLDMMAKARKVRVSGTQELYYTGVVLAGLEGAYPAAVEGSDQQDQARETPCYAAAPQTMQEMLDFYIDIGEPLGQAVILGEIASAHGDVGQHQAALLCYLEELAIYQEIHVTLLEGITLNNIGATYRYLGQYQKALTYYLDALDRWQLLADPAREAVTRDNIGVVYQYLRQLDKALVYHHQALALFQEVKDVSGQGSALNNIGLAESYSGRYEEATDHFSQALAIWQKRGESAREAITLSNIGFVYEKTGRHQEALDRFQQALAIFRRLGQRGYEGGALANIGAAYDSMGSYQQALDYYQQALDIMQEIGDQEGTGNVLIDIGFTFENLGDRSQALAAYQQAIQVIESVQGDIQIESMKSTYAAAQVPVYERIISLFWGSGQAAEAFAYAERARARAFLDQIGNQQVEFRAHSAPELITREQTLRLAIIDLQKALGDERAKPVDQQNQSLLDTLSAELEQARKDYEELLTRLKLESPEYASLVSVNTLTLEEVQSQVLDEHTTLIEYFVMDDRILAWIVDQEGFELVSLDITRTDLRNQVEFLRKLIARRDFDEQTAASLYGILVAPLTSHIRHSNLVIVPHGVLHYLPFAALWDAESERYLVQDYALTYAPSASVLKFIQDKRNPDQGRALVLGNPDGSLPYAAAEVEAIADLYGTSPLLGQQATENEIYAQAGQLDVLHLAAHGVYNPFNPLFTRIELASDASDDTHDGSLEVHEVYGLDLEEANLVVLSACETALGEQSAGDELVGLTRAFLYAGAPAVVTTLWSIDDQASAVLMETFYRHLAEGMGNAEALRAAQLSVLAREQWSTPYYWAAFSLTGDYRGNDQPGVVAQPLPKLTPTATLAQVLQPTVVVVTGRAPAESQPGSEPASEEGGQGGPCGSAVLPLALVVLAGAWRGRTSRKEMS